MRKRHLTLTSDQKQRGIIFSSVLLPSDNPCIHEVHKDDEDGQAKIERLKNDKFFNSSPYKYNEIRS